VTPARPGPHDDRLHSEAAKSTRRTAKRRKGSARGENHGVVLAAAPGAKEGRSQAGAGRNGRDRHVGRELAHSKAELALGSQPCLLLEGRQAHGRHHRPKRHAWQGEHHRYAAVPGAREPPSVTEGLARCG
jgi:hypothetical protein